jgi:hypothetical protein
MRPVERGAVVNLQSLAPRVLGGTDLAILKSQRAIEALEHLRHYIPGHWIMVWDRASTHKRVKASVGILSHRAGLVAKQLSMTGSGLQAAPQHACRRKQTRQLRPAYQFNPLKAGASPAKVNLNKCIGFIRQFRSNGYLIQVDSD